MPFTPFHFGAGLLCKGLGGKRVSFGAFALVNVAIDVEVLVNVAVRRGRLHAELHTLWGAMAMAFVVMLAWRGLLTRLNGAWARRARARHSPEWYVREFVPVTRGACVVGASLGAVTHVGLDALTHADVLPLLPWRLDNPLLLPPNMTWTVTAGCALAGVIGYVVWLLRARRAWSEAGRSSGRQHGQDASVTGGGSSDGSGA